MDPLSREERLFMTACKGPCRTLTLCNRGLQCVPSNVKLLRSSVTGLALQNNVIDSVADEVGELHKLASLNLGNNKLSVIPACLTCCPALAKLQLYNNPLNSLDPSVLGSLASLTSLNLNSCGLQEVPGEIGKLVHLESLSLDENGLEVLPSDVGNLAHLRRLHVRANRLRRLPGAIGQLRCLEHLSVAKNQLIGLPRTIGQCVKLTKLDTAVNMISFYPSEILNLKLSEFATECNQLIPRIPVLPMEKNEVLPLKELVGRQVLSELRTQPELVKLMQERRPDLYAWLSAGQKCSVCEAFFLSTCIECVHYIDSRKAFRLALGGGKVPVQALLCSHQCFRDQPGSTQYYGILHLRSSSDP